MVGEARTFLREDERIPIDGISDIRNLLGRATVDGAYLDGAELNVVASTLAGARRLRSFLAGNGEDAPLLVDLTEPIFTNRLLEKHIADAIDESGEVRDSASRELADIRRDIIAKSAALRARLTTILRRVADDDLLTEEFVTLAEGRLVLPVRVEYKRRIPGIIHGESQTGSTVYLEPAEIFDTNNEIAELRFAERREVERILKILSSEVGADADAIAESLWRVAAVDSVVARARYAEEFDCCEPVLDDNRLLLAESARHPGLLLRTDRVVPMSIELGSGVDCVIISGPNAGGKTVAMKTLGLVTSLAQSGFHIPADRFTFSTCRIYTDIGDRQSVENDLSTFSAHMSRVGAIIDATREGDLVLLDELGTGTDPDEGAAIAAAILERLLAGRTRIMATTHHSALKVFAYEHDGIENAGMEFDTETLAPTYRLLLGIPGNSYAFELLERFGFSSSLIESARRNLGDDRSNLSDVVSQLESSLAVARRREAEAAQALREADEVRQRTEAREKELREKGGGIVAEAREQARAILSDANALVENTIREVRSGAGKDEVREMRRAISEARSAQRPAKGPSRSEPQRRPFDVGTSVRMKEGTETGEVLAVPDDRGFVLVQFGPIRMRASLDELVEVKGGGSSDKKRRPSPTLASTSEPIRTRLDLRGMYSDEAMQEIESALSAALSSGLDRLEIIHGKGTGALRTATHGLLDGHPAVATFRLGTLTEGGAGVTIVELN